MSLQEDIYAVLDAALEARVFPQLAEHNEGPPFVVYRRLSKDTELTLCGDGPRRSSFVFECYSERDEVTGGGYGKALDLAQQVRDAIDPSALISIDAAESGEEYDSMTDRYMEPVYYDFWET